MNLEELVNKYYENLNSTDLLIWKYIYNHKKACQNYSINELAEKCNVSRTTIMRFAQKLSLDGYSELKVMLKRDKEMQLTQTIDELKDWCVLYQHIIQELEKKDYTKICKMIHRANRIFAFGSGAFQKNLVYELRRMFYTTGKYIVDIGGNGGFRYLMENITSDDMVIIISMSGESSSSIKLAKSLKLKNVPILSVTKLKDNPLAFLCDENIYISVKSYYINSGKDYPYETGAGFFLAMELLYMEYQIYERKLKEKECENSQEM